MNDLLLSLRDKGNTVLVVEHKPETIRIADQIIDLGPGAGRAGGQITFQGNCSALIASDTITGRHFGHRVRLKDSDCVREPHGNIRVRGAFAKANGVKAAMFSANSEGACPTCHGLGGIYTEVGFTDTVSTPCEVCEGRPAGLVESETITGRHLAEYTSH